MGQTQILEHICDYSTDSGNLKTATNREGFTPLTYAAFCKQDDMVDYLS